MKKIIRILFLLVALPTIVLSQKKLKVPSFEEVLSLPFPSSPQISPNGENVIFQVRTADWESNRYDTELWLSKNGEKPIQLTYNGNSSSYDPKWSPDGQWIAFLSDSGNGSQIHVIRFDGGNSFPATNIAQGVYSYEWSPDSSKFAFIMDQNDSNEDKKISERFGNFEIDDEGYKHSWLYTVDFNPNHIKAARLPCYGANDCITWATPVPLIDKVDFSIGAFKWSPDGSKIVFNKQPDPLINAYLKSDIGILDVEEKEWKVLIENSSYDFLIDWSPDSKSILYITALDKNNSTFYHNNHYFIIDIKTNKKKEIAKGFDDELKDMVWAKNGIYTMAYQKTNMQLFVIDPTTGIIKLVKDTPERIDDFSISSNGSAIAFVGNTDETIKEIYTASLTNYTPKKITNFNDTISGWKVAQSEIISWKSNDGVTIEGVLHKPKNYDPTKKYPLLIAVHGGPTAADRPTPIPVFYPVLQWLDKGALVLQPNYRGSGGYGEKFRSLNVRNLGIGAASDILSGVDYLDSLGIIDTSKMGCMGWSHGGYISAFLATTSNRFKAISVGAGITNWQTDYTNADLHPFTVQYLKATPWSDPAIYKKTSPITYINQATTPTLIQHGEYDKRVPIANAYELLQGLRDVGVDTKLVVYKGLGHRISKPKERLAAVWHNWQWFGNYIFDEDVKIPLD